MFFCPSTHDALDSGEYCTRLRKKVYIHFKFIVRKLEIRPVPFFQTHSDPQLPLSKFISYSMFNLLHLSDQEVCNVYRSRGDTTAACKHVTSYFVGVFFFFFFKILLFFFHSGYSESKGAPARVHSRAWVQMSVEEQT